MSSSCSSTDLGIDTDFDDVLSESLINDIELFAEHMHRLRHSLDVKRSPPLGLEGEGGGGGTVNETKCVQVHAALSMVSQSIRDLLVKHPHFKTSNVLIPASQLVHSVKGINFAQSNFDASRALHAIERLEAAIGNALRHCVNTKLFVAEHTPTISTPLYLHHNNNNGAQQHPLKQTTTNNKSNDTNNNCGGGGSGTRQQQQLLGNEDALNNNREYYYANGYCSSGVGGKRPPSSATGGAIGAATAQLLIGAGGLMADHPMRRGGAVPSVLKTTPLATKQPHGGSGKMAAPRLVRRHSAYQAGAGNSLTGSSSATVHSLTSSNFANNSNNMKNIDSAAQLMRDALVAHEHGMELAFERCKRWSKYAGHLLQFIRGRLALEQEQARSAQKLAEQTRALLSTDAENHHLPLVGVFEQLMDGSGQFAGRVQNTVNMLNHRFIATLESRQKEHDAKRRKLKTDWSKQKKQFDACAEELRRARLTLNTKEGGYLKARDLAMRHEQQVVAQQQQQPMLCGGLPSSAGGGISGGGSNAVLTAMMSVESSISAAAADPQQQKKLEKKRKNEEDALIRKTDAENEVWRLEREWEARRLGLNELRFQIVGELCDSIRHCDLTTIACSSHFFKAFAELWAPLPDEFDRLAADAMRERSPSTEYMQFLHGLPPNNSNSKNSNNNTQHRNTAASTSDDCATASSSSMLAMKQQRVSASLDDDAIRGSGGRPSTSAAGSQSAAMPRRRNALNADEHYELISDPMVAGAQRRQKKSMTRLFEQSSSSSSVDAASDAARSHQLQRTRQVTKCAHCEHLVIFDALKCSTCGIVWHKKCLPAVTVICGPSARRLSEDPALAAQRRMSIFGVPLAGHLDAQHRRIPHIMERCVDELHRRGMSCKGLYRTCGVKSKIEQLCVRFEQLVKPDELIDLSNVHPMNLASVIKLYLRRLPEPLMTYELYDDWLHFNACDSAVTQLRDLVSRLPQQNYDTLKFLILHLKRVTWFELENLMTASNLAAVISPSLIWPRSASLSLTASMDVCPINATGGNGSSSFINDAHQQTKVVELMVQNAYDVFLIDRSTDWREFFESYPDVVPPKLVEDPETEASIAAKSRAELSLKRRSCVASTSVEAPRADEDDDDDDDEEEDEDEELDEELDEDDVYDICGCDAPPNSFASTTSSAASKQQPPFSASKSLEEQGASGRHFLQRRHFGGAAINRQLLPPPHPSSTSVFASATPTTVSQLPVYQRSPSAPAPVIFDSNTVMVATTEGGAMTSSTCSTTTSSSSSKAERRTQPGAVRGTSSNSGSIGSSSASSSVDGHTNGEHGFQRNTMGSGSGGGGSAAAKALNRFVGLKRFRNQRSNTVGTTNDGPPITVVITSSSAAGSLAAPSGTKSAPHTAQPTGVNATMPPLVVAAAATATRSVSTSNDTSASSLRPSTTAVYASPSTSRRRRPLGDSLTHNGGGKPRSFTTSILVSPQSDRKFAAILAQKQQSSMEDACGGDAEQHSTAVSTSASTFSHINGATPMNGGALTARRKLRETARSYQRLDEDDNDIDATDEYFGTTGYDLYDESPSSASSDLANGDDEDAALRHRRRRTQLAAVGGGIASEAAQQPSTRSKRTLCSGEVVVDIKKDQFCVPQTARSARAVGRNGAPLSSASFTTMTTATESPTNVATVPAWSSHASRASLRKDTSVDGPSPPQPSAERKQRLERSAAYRNVAEVVVKSRADDDDEDDDASLAASRSIYENANGGCVTNYQCKTGNYNRIAAAAAAALTGMPKAMNVVKSGGGGGGGGAAMGANVIFTGSGDVSYV